MKNLSIYLLLTALTLVTTPALADDMDFSSIDTNHDGFIDANELLNLQQMGINNPNDETFQIIDANNDGKITKEEFMQIFAAQNTDATAAKELEERFKAADADNNGYLSPSEITQFRQNNLMSDNKELFLALDSNGDNKISEQEFNEFFSFVRELLKQSY